MRRVAQVPSSSRRSRTNSRKIEAFFPIVTSLHANHISDAAVSV
jgi:hypothetical protein